MTAVSWSTSRTGVADRASTLGRTPSGASAGTAPGSLLPFRDAARDQGRP